MNNLLDINKLKNIKLNKVGYFRFKKFDEEKYLITGIFGQYCFLKKIDFSNFISGKLDLIDKQKYKELEKKDFIKSENYEKNSTLKLKENLSYLNIGPSLHILVLTLRCNHACRYCHASVSNEQTKGKDMSIETAKNIVDTIFFTSSNSITIEFQGGEPLLNFEVLKFVVEYSRNKAKVLQKKLNFALVTNLSLMDKEKLNFLMQNNIGISTSLDGDETIHNYNRVYKKGNSFKEVIKWIKKINDIYIKNKSKNRVGALTTVTRKTLSGYKTLIDTFIEIGIDSIFLRPLNPYGFAVKNFKDIGYTYKEFNEFYNNSMNYIMELNNKGIYIKEYFTTIFLEKILTQKDPNFLDERSPCGAGIGQVAYNYDGKIYTCDEGRMFGELGDYSFLIGEIGNDPKLNYVNIIDNNVTKSILHASITDGLPGYNDSVYKPYIGICPIYNYKKNGNIFANYTLDNRLKISSNIINYIFENIQNKKSLKIFNNWIKK